MTDTRSSVVLEKPEARQPTVSPLAEEQSPQPDAPADEPPPKTTKPSRKVVVAMSLLFVVGALIVLYAWQLWPFTSDDRTTENAYVRGQITAMAPQVNGYVVEVRVRDFAPVKAGDILMRIDDRIYRQQLDQALAQLKVAQADLANWDQTIAQNRAILGTKVADLKQAQAELVRAGTDFDRVSELASRGSVSIRERDQVRATTADGAGQRRTRQREYRKSAPNHSFDASLARFAGGKSRAAAGTGATCPHQSRQHGDQRAA